MKHFLQSLAAILFIFCSSLYAENKQEIPIQSDSLVYPPIQQLDSVVVIADNITHYADRDVVRITRAMRKGARNTAQMLGNIPGIDCDYSNNALTYYGSSNILILVDSLEKSADYIKELHHLRFVKVDIIPNPTGKYANYDVLINLHTKDDYEGYESNLSNYMKILPSDGNGKKKNLVNENASASFTYTKNKWNIVGRYNFRFNQSEITDVDKSVSYNINKFEENYLSPTKASNYFRIHNAYTATDYQINKNHSISASYHFSTDASDKYTHANIDRLWSDTGIRDTIKKEWTEQVNSTRHTLGLYYRGRSGVWNYTYDFNYINDGWTSDHMSQQSTGYSSDNHYRYQMNYIWTKSEVNRRFFSNRLYVSIGHNFTWKDYEQKDRFTNDILSENTYNRNEFWTWISYRIKDGTDLNFSASAEHVHTESSSYKDDNMVYKLSGMFFHRWNKSLWMRLNYWCDIRYPQLDQVTEYGYFTDTLTWKGGNPSLRTNVNHSGRIWMDFFKTFNIQGGFAYSPNRFSTIADVEYGTLPSGIEGYYVTYIPQNTKYKETWASFYIYKKVKALTLSAYLKYQTMEAKYREYKNTNEGFSGNISTRYYIEEQHLTLALAYYLSNMYNVSTQGKSTRDFDFFNFTASKDFFKQRLNTTFQYTLPVFFTNTRFKGRNDSNAITSFESINIKKSNANAFMLTISYRFNGGKSIRQYNRQMQEEK